ncbi:MAG: MerR family transcriptional regulator [Rhodoferax sp.]|nr:MerR family transcriptional regulator [Rhodoferax sp.]
MATSTKPLRNASTGHRIGAVSALSGIPVSTLRIWEIRYATFQPRLSEGGQRLYSDDDVLRATLLKRLTERGHTISGIANLDTGRLNTLLQQQNTSQRHDHAKHADMLTVSAAVVGLSLAARLATETFKRIFADNALHITDIHPDLEAALAAPAPADQPQFLLVSVNSLHVLAQVDLQRLIDRCKLPQTIVLYRFGQEQVIESLKRAGVVVRREPVSDHDLADLINASLLVDAPRAMWSGGHWASSSRARKYDDATLARMAGISTNVLCECPRHVAEIIAQLASFEQYSQECLNKSSEDAHLHAYLHSVSGSARALFEHALEKVAHHEGLVL